MSLHCAAAGLAQSASAAALLLLIFLPLLQVLAAPTDDGFPGTRSSRAPIILDRSGGFNVAGTVISSPLAPNQTLTCDHGYMEYFIPRTPRQTSLVMWHSSSTQVFQNRWDGGEGFKDKFLRRNYPVYLWDGPRVGRANWACVPTFYAPDYRDHVNFVAWNFGPQYPDWWPGVQFPTDNAEAWQQATGGRYVEYDTIPNVHLETDAAAVGADSGKLGKSIVYLTNSASGFRGMMTAIKSNTTNIKALVMYECVGFVYPDTANVTAGTGGFGPLVVPVEQFKKLAKLPIVQFVWGDNRNESYPDLKQARLVAKYINLYGGNAQVLKLGEDAGLKGSTHSAFADMDNDKVAALLDKLLWKYGLDRYVGAPDNGGGDGGDDGDDEK